MGDVPDNRKRDTEVEAMNKKLEEILAKVEHVRENCPKCKDTPIEYGAGCDEHDDLFIAKQAFAAGQSSLASSPSAHNRVPDYYIVWTEDGQSCVNVTQKSYDESLAKEKQKGRQDVLSWLKERAEHWNGEPKALVNLLLAEMKEKFSTNQTKNGVK